MTAPRHVSLIIVEDNELHRAGLKAYFETEADIEVVGDFGHPADAVAATKLLQPSVVLVSLNLADGTPFETCRELTGVSPNTQVVTLGASPTKGEDVATSLMIASSHLPKGASRTDFLRVVRAVAAGEILDIAEVANLIRRFTRAFPGPVNLAALSSRERSVLMLISDGLNNPQIARRLEISPHTVRKHVSSVLRKLNVSSRAELGIYAPVVSILRDDADPQSGL